MNELLFLIKEITLKKNIEYLELEYFFNTIHTLIEDTIKNLHS